jgi:hypothetical protein
VFGRRRGGQFDSGKSIKIKEREVRIQKELKKLYKYVGIANKGSIYPF